MTIEEQFKERRQIGCVNCNEPTEHRLHFTAMGGAHWFCIPCEKNEKILHMYPSVTADGKVCLEKAIYR